MQEKTETPKEESFSKRVKQDAQTLHDELIKFPLQAKTLHDELIKFPLQAKTLHDELIKFQLQRDTQWHKVRFIDFMKKYNIESAIIRKDPAMVQFTIGGNTYTYLKIYEAATCFTYEPLIPETPEAKALFADLINTGIITEEGEVNYEYGV